MKFGISCLGYSIQKATDIKRLNCQMTDDLEEPNKLKGCGWVL